MTRYAVAIAFMLMVGAVFAAPASATTGDTVKFQQRYSIPDDLAEVEDLGELNIPCSGGNYTLVDGTFKKKVTATFVPNEEAWNQGEAGATMTVVGRNTYNGLWDVDNTDARYELRDSTLRYEFTVGANPDDEPESFRFRWAGRFVERDTGDIVEWFNFDVTFDDAGEAAIIEGTCSL